VGDENETSVGLKVLVEDIHVKSPVSRWLCGFEYSYRCRSHQHKNVVVVGDPDR
jgi:hypothetical protein